MRTTLVGGLLTTLIKNAARQASSMALFETGLRFLANPENVPLTELDEFIGLFPVFPVTTEIAKKGGLHKRDYFKSHSVGLADGIIAATTETHDVDLKTLNTKHYPMLKGLKRPYFK